MHQFRKRRSLRVKGLRQTCDETLSLENQLLTRTLNNGKIETDIYQIVCEDFIEKCRVVQLVDGDLVIITPNSAIQSKLKQVTPTLVKELRIRGYKISTVTLKITKR